MVCTEAINACCLSMLQPHLIRIMDMTDQRTFGQSLSASAVCRDTYQCNHRINYILLHLFWVFMFTHGLRLSLFVCLKYKSNQTSDFIVAGLARKIKRRTRRRKMGKNNNQKKSYSAVVLIFRVREATAPNSHFFYFFFFCFRHLRCFVLRSVPTIPLRLDFTIKSFLWP